MTRRRTPLRAVGSTPATADLSTSTLPRRSPRTPVQPSPAASATGSRHLVVTALTSEEEQTSRRCSNIGLAPTARFAGDRFDLHLGGQSRVQSEIGVVH